MGVHHSKSHIETVTGQGEYPEIARKKLFQEKQFDEITGMCTADIFKIGSHSQAKITFILRI